MLKRQENKLSMYRITEKLLNDNPSIINSIPAFPITKNAFAAKISIIQTASGKQLANNTGISTDKKKLKIILVDHAIIIAGAICAYAAQTNNNELLQAVNFSRTKLIKARSGPLVSLCQNIHKLASDNFTPLTSFNITLPQLNQLQLDIDNYYKKIPAPGLAQAQKQSSTALIAKTFREADIILKLQLDNLMVRFKKTNPDFYKAYKIARQIINHGVTHTTLRVIAKDKQGKPIAGAIVSLLQNNKTIYSKTTTASGIISISKIHPGIFHLKVESSPSAKYIPVSSI